MSKKLSRFGGLMLIVSVNTQQMGKWHGNGKSGFSFRFLAFWV